MENRKEIATPEGQGGTPTQQISSVQERKAEDAKGTINAER